MNTEATTVSADGFEYSGPSDDLTSDLAALAPAPKVDDAPPKAEAKTDPPPAKAEPPKADDKPLSAQETHDRIQRLTWEREEANRRAEAAETRERERERAAAAVKPKVDSAPKPSTRAEVARYMAMEGAPRIDDKADDGTDLYADFAEFSAAQSIFIADKRFEELRAQDRAEAQRGQRAQSAQERHKSFHEALQAEKAVDAEFDALLANSTASVDENGPMSYVISSARDEKGVHIGAKILKWLALNPDESNRIAAIENPHVRYGEMKVIEGLVKASLKASAAPPGSASPEPAAKVATKAEPPINPVGSSPVSVKDDTVLSDDLDDDEYFRRRDKLQREERMRGVRR